MSRTSTLVAANNIHTLKGTKVPDALGALIKIFTGVSILFQVVAMVAVALI